MTPLEEAVARIIDPEAFRFPNSDRWEVERHLAHLKARTILALPEIVKMQEALEQCADRFAAFNKWQLNGRAGPVPQYEAAHTFARAALQPLKKEAE